MIIENVEALKKWLMETVAPICDADPEPLSRYCLALVKKDKPESELREFCLDQLEVFLQGKTPGFVDVLFDALTSKVYLQSEVKVKEEPVDNVQEKPSSTTDEVQVKTEPKEVDTTVSDIKLEPTVKKSNAKDDQKDLRDVIRKRHGSKSPSPRRRDRDYDERRRRSNDRRIRRRSRSRSPVRQIRGRSPPRVWSPRDRSPRGRSRSPKNWSPRGRSPPRGRSRSPRGRSPPRRILSRESPRRWSRSPKSWSPRGRSPKVRQRSPRRSRSWSRSRSRSLGRSRSRSRSDDRKKDSRGPTPTMDNGKYKESNIPVMGVTVYSTAHGESSDTKTVTSRPRCKDYDEQGFCMRGDLCPYDHGTDPVIVEDVSMPSYPPPSGPPPPPPSVGLPMPPHVPPPPIITGPPPPRPERFEPYNPEAPSMSRPPPFWTRPPGPPPMSGPPPGPPGMFMMHGPPLPPNLQQPRSRDLVNIQTLPDKRPDDLSIHPPGTEPVRIPPSVQPERMVIAPKRPYDNGQDRQYGQPPNKKPFDFSRVGGYRKPGANNTNTSLEVRKIPRDMNNISKLNEYFGRFGTLTNVQVSFEGDPEAALVSFASNAQAFAAYKNSEPLFNNRFIKVFFHRSKDKKEQGDESDSTTSAPSSTTPTPPPPKQNDQRNVRLRVEIPPAHKMSLNNTISKQSDVSKPEKSILFTPSVGVITKTVYNHSKIVARPKITSPTAVGSAQFVSKIEAIKKQEDLKKEAIKKKAEIQKQKQELLLKQIEQQKKLIEKLEKNKNLSADDKDKIKQTLKILTNSIEKLTKEVIPSVQQATSPVATELPVITSPEQAKKEILDTELELFNKQQCGEDTIVLRKKLNELTKQATAMGLIGRGRGRGMRGGRGRGFVPTRGAMTWVAGGQAAAAAAPARGRGTSYFPVAKSRTLDNRPKQLEVTGFKMEQKDLIEPHFKQYGIVDRIDFDEVDNSAILTYKTRQDAENAVLRGSRLQDSVLSMKWHTGVKINIRLNVSSDDSFTGEHNNTVEEVADEIDEEALLADEEDALLGGEDEEEEDEESRSWRR